MTSCCLTSLTLAASGDWIEIVIYGIGTVIVVGGWIANQMSQLRAEQERRRKIAELEGGQGPQAARHEAAAEPVPTQAELARRRREQLAALSRRRRSPGHAASRGAAPRTQPTNLSPAEMTQRQRAQEAYERRARELREQREQKEREQQAARGRYEQELARRRQETEQTRRRRQLQQQAQRSARPAPQPAPSRPPMPSALTPRRERPTDERLVGAGAREAGTIENLRRAAQVPVIAAAHIRELDAAMLRRAIVLKEVLDQPVALRDPLAGVPGLA